MRPWPALLAAVLISGCAANRERVVLLPGAQGRTGALVVHTRSGEAELATPYAAAEIKDGRIALGTSNEEEVRRRYGDLLRAQPPRPRSYTVYFYFDDTELKPESKALLAHIEAELAADRAAQIVIIGHADRVGTEHFNDRLSLQRAQAVRDALIGSGVPAGSIEVAGRGEREPAMPTADGVPEPGNRRAEIKLR